MDIKIKGKQTLSGEIYPSGYKNSAVAMLPASLLFDKPVTFKNIPHITDIDRLINILKKLGSKIQYDQKNSTITIDNSAVRFEKLDRDDLGNMKGVSLLWGPMLARFGKVHFAGLPGGCTLGFRTLGPHYKAFEDLGVRVKETANSAEMSAEKAKAKTIFLTEMSPTATENILMFATRLSGITKIIGASSEPQVQDLCNFLVSCGAKISGIGSSVLDVEGGIALTPQTHTIISDDHEIATFIALAAATGGYLRVHNTNPETFTPIKNVFEKFGVNIEYDGTTALVKPDQKVQIEEDEGRGHLLVKPRPWPGLMVDNLPLFIALSMASKSGQVMFHNWMYDGGLYWTSELKKFGAHVVLCDPHRVLINTGCKIKGATVEAPYIIRAVIGLLMTALIAEGESVILNADVLYRGHPNFAENLRKLGAKIEESN